MTQRTFIDACRFANFLTENYPEVGTWEDPVGYCAWYIGQGFITTVVNEQGRIIALGCGRPVEGPGFGAIPFHFKEDGPCIHIDLVVIKNHEFSKLGLAKMMLLRFGPRKQVCFFRNHEERLRVHGYDSFLRNATRLTHKEKRELHESEITTSST